MYTGTRECNPPRASAVVAGSHIGIQQIYFSYLSFTDTWLRKWNIFSLSAVHPYGNCPHILLPTSISLRVLETKICYVVEQF